MKKLNNKGFSIVEIIIAIAVFVVLIIPVINQLGSSMKIAANSKKQQKGSEYAEYIMEYFKGNPLDAVGSNNLFGGSNAFVETTTPTAGKEEKIISLTVDGTTVEYAERTFEIPKASAVNLGGAGDKNKYYAKVTVDTKDYALAALGYRPFQAGDATDDKVKIDGEDYIKDNTLIANGMKDPNKVNTVGLSNLDSSKVAIIAGSTANFDETAADAFFAIKAQKLKAMDEDKWMQLMYGTNPTNEFSFDEATKVTRITIKKEVVGGNTSYYVSCQLEYQDDAKNVYNLKAEDQIYNVYSQSFTQDEIPKIYFMYNPFVYNGEYSVKDYVVVDTEGLDADEKAKVYMIKTTDVLPQNIKDVIDGSSVEFTSANLVKNARGSRNSVTTYVNIDGSKDNLEIYTNIPLTYINDYTVFDNVDNTKPANTAPGQSVGPLMIDHFVKPLSDDSEYNGRLYTVNVELYDMQDTVVAKFQGTRGAD